jgi:uncharacterized protein (DUF427 family)
MGSHVAPLDTTTMKAIWNDTVIAESNDTVLVEGNHYFPPQSLVQEYFRPATTHTVCAWKGTSSYYDVVVDGEVNAGAAWYYPSTTDEAKHIEGRVAFWRGVRVKP